MGLSSGHALVIVLIAYLAFHTGRLLVDAIVVTTLVSLIVTAFIFSWVSFGYLRHAKKTAEAILANTRIKFFMHGDKLKNDKG